MINLILRKNSELPIPKINKNTSIDQNLGIKILDKLIELDTNIHAKDYYGSTIID